MEAFSATVPLIAWDGGRHVAIALPGSDSAVSASVIAHGPMASACVAVFEASAGGIIVVLPDGAAHLDITLSAPGRDTAVVTVELDSQLAPAMADLAQPGLGYVGIATTPLSLQRTDVMPQGGFTALNLATSAPGGLRLKAGPIVDIGADSMVTSVAIAVGPGGVTLTFARPRRPSPVLVAFMPSDPGALAGSPADITGTGGTEAAARGFLLQSPQADGSLGFGYLKAGDAIAVFAPRRHRITVSGKPRPGTRLVITAGPSGDLVEDLTSQAYKAATSTALAALSGGALTESGGSAKRGGMDDAAALAEAYWMRRRPGAEEGPERIFASEVIPLPDEFPLARLTAAAASYADATVSPLMAAVGAKLALAPAIVEEIDGLPAGDRAALAAWTALDAATASAACACRVTLPQLGDANQNMAATAAVEAAGKARFPHDMAELSERLKRLGGDAPDRTFAATALRLSEEFGDAWTGFAEIAEALALLKRHPAPQTQLSPTAMLLSDLKKTGAQWREAQAEARTTDLAVIAEKRSLIPVAFVGAGLTEELADDIEARLSGLSAEEILLLHRHLTRAAGRQALVRGVRIAIDAMDAAAGTRGLAARMDRSGDPLIGMTRIGSAAEPVMRELARMPEARDALVALNTWINACVPAPETGHAMSERLVRNLKSYGCFLLMHAVRAECRKLMEPATAGAAAFAGRLTSGLVETLPVFAAAAAARHGGDIKLGATFTDGLPGLHGKTGT